jgi:hypothetical protein
MKEEKEVVRSLDELKENPIENWRELHQRYGLLRRGFLYLPGRMAERLWRGETRRYLTEFDRQMSKCKRHFGPTDTDSCFDECPFYEWVIEGRQRREQEVYHISVLTMVALSFMILLIFETHLG